MRRWSQSTRMRDRSATQAQCPLTRRSGSTGMSAALRARRRRTGLSGRRRRRASPVAGFRLLWSIVHARRSGVTGGRVGWCCCVMAGIRRVAESGCRGAGSVVGGGCVVGGSVAGLGTSRPVAAATEAAAGSGLNGSCLWQQVTCVDWPTQQVLEWRLGGSGVRSRAVRSQRWRGGRRGSET
jgi:hypothetical protein